MKSIEEIVEKYKTVETTQVTSSSWRDFEYLSLYNAQLAMQEFSEQFTQKEVHPQGEQVPADFLEYCKDARNKFCKFISGYEWRTDLRTEIDDLLICFGQMKERLEKRTLPALLDSKNIVCPNCGCNKYRTDAKEPAQCVNCGNKFKIENGKALLT